MNPKLRDGNGRLEESMKTIGLVLLVGLASALGSVAFAETLLVRSVVGCGGDVVTGSNRTVRSTAGQSAVGSVQGSGYLHGLGFWPEAGGVPSVVLPGLTGLIPPRASLRVSGANPFRSHTSVEYAVPVRSSIRITLYDVTGREVRALARGTVEPGYHRIDLASRNLVSGVYLCRMTAPGFATTRRIVVLK